MTEGTKRCYRCKSLLPLDRFARCAGRADGLQTMCRGCRTEYMRERRAGSVAVREYDRTRARARITRDPAAHREREWRNRTKRAGGQVADFTVEQLQARLSMFPGCWMCGGTPDQVDHVKPIDKGGAHMLCNIRPACGPCNTSKGRQWPLHKIPMLQAKATVGPPVPPIVNLQRQYVSVIAPAVEDH